jgi:hypothetical protein
MRFIKPEVSLDAINSKMLPNRGSAAKTSAFGREARPGCRWNALRYGLAKHTIKASSTESDPH